MTVMVAETICYGLAGVLISTELSLSKMGMFKQLRMKITRILVNAVGAALHRWCLQKHN